MAKLWRLLACTVLVSVVVVSGCSSPDDRPGVTTTYTTIDEQSSRIGSDGGQIELDDRSSVAVPEDIFDEEVMVTLSRASATGELPSSIEEDPDSQLISDFYFLQVDRVLSQEPGIVLELPFRSPYPGSVARVIEVFNIGDETHVRFVGATVDEASGTAQISDAEFSPTSAAIQKYETEFPPTETCGFDGMGFSLGYAVISDRDQGNQAPLSCCSRIQPQTTTVVCVTRWGRIRCYGERVEVEGPHLATGDEMSDYVVSIVRFADSIQNAYSDAGFKTHDKILVTVTRVAHRDGLAHAGWNRVLVKTGLATTKGGRLNYVINHETVHTMQSFFQPGWWQESSAQWIGYHFEPDPEARQQLGSDEVFFKAGASGNPYLKPFPWSGAEYDYDILIDFAVEVGSWTPEDIVRYINASYVPTTELAHLYREQPHGFARHLAERGIIRDLEYLTAPGHQLDFRNSGSVELSIEVDPLTLPFMYLEPEAGGVATFSVYLRESENEGGVVIYSDGHRYEGTRHRNPERLRTEPTSRLYFFPYAQGSDSAKLELLIEWWPNVEYDLTISSTEGGHVTAPGEGTFTYWAGDIERLIAEPDDGYRFVDWTGDVDTVSHLDEAVSTITIVGHHSITANFEKRLCVGEGVRSGSITAWPDKGYVIFSFDDHVGVVTDLRAWWSMCSFGGRTAWFYEISAFNEGSTSHRIAYATGVTHIAEITDASAFSYSDSYSVGCVGEGEFVLFHNTETGYYAALRVDRIYGPLGELLLDATWYVQTDGSPSFAGDSC